MSMEHKLIGSRRNLRAFTLVELMVAVTGGLFLSVIVFAMARQGTRFYQQESRISEATLAATIGMQRLRADIGRAGYMASANIAADSALCQNTAANGFTATMRSMRSVQISQETNEGVTNNADLQSGAATPIVPDRILLAGAYQNADRFIAGALPPAPLGGVASLAIPLQPGIGALVRYRYSLLSSSAQNDLLSSLFPTVRVLRLVNQYGKVAYSLILGTTATGGPASNLPTINIGPPFPPLAGASPVCQFAGVGVEVNVVNFFQIRIANVQKELTDSKQFGQLYATSANPWDANRTELVREEIDPTTGQPFTVTGANNQQTPLPPEIVSEYAIDLRFQVIYASPWPNPIQLLTTSADSSSGSTTVYSIAGAGAGTLPQSVRSVRTRLSVRSREADRNQPIPGTGLYRLGITANGVKSYARVRTLQADVALPNQFTLKQ